MVGGKGRRNGAPSETSLAIILPRLPFQEFFNFVSVSLSYLGLEKNIFLSFTNFSLLLFEFSISICNSKLPNQNLTFSLKILPLQYYYYSKPLK